MEINHLTDRASGVLMPVFALPSDAYNGTMGEYAYRFVDFLAQAGQKYWQFLPMQDKCVLTNSPYSPISSVAGDMRYIDSDFLYQKNHLNDLEYKQICYFQKVERSLHMNALLRKREIAKSSFLRRIKQLPEEFYEFCQKEDEDWLDNYAVYSSIKNDMLLPFYDWPDDLKFRDKDTLQAYKKEHKEDILFYKYLQFTFYQQWFNLKTYANSKDVKLIGDIPYFMNHDSPEVWENPNNYCLDDGLKMQKLACYPPESDDEEIKIYGFPLYNWEYFEQTDYKWLKDKINYAKRMYDVIRFDHFIGYDTIFYAEEGATHVSQGQWEDSHIDAFVSVLKDICSEIPVSIESSFCFSDKCNSVIEKYELQKILCVQDMIPENEVIDNLPECVHDKNCILCLGNHDTNTLVGWINEATSAQIESACGIFNAQSKDELADKMLEWFPKTETLTTIYQMQDLLGLDETYRSNTPNSYTNCFEWQLSKEQFAQLDPEKLKQMTQDAGR